jgi:succinate dehydrogenase / fumarate reductase flavoprotein subunit
MLVVAEAVTRSALARQESRGAHSRIDFPKTEDAWGKKNHVIARHGSAMALVEVPVREMPDDLKQILAEDK